MLPDKLGFDFKIDDYINNNYAPVNDCTGIDMQILNLAKDLDKLNKMKIEYGSKIEYKSTGFGNSQRLIPVKKTIQNAQDIQQLKTKLSLLQKNRENQSALKDCRNTIESTRQEETANIFSTTTSQAETRIISDSKQKQYVLLGVGGLVLIGVLYIIIKNRK